MKKDRFKLTKVILRFAKPYRLSFISQYLCMFFRTLMGTMFPIITGTLIDEVFYHRNQHMFLPIVICYTVLLSGSSLLNVVQVSTWQYLFTKFLYDIRITILQKVYEAKADFLTNIRTGDIITRINEDTEQFMNIIDRNVFSFINTVFVYVSSLLFVAFINIKIAIFLLLIIPLVTFITEYYRKENAKFSVENRQKNGVFTSWVFEILKGLREIKLFAGEKSVARHYVKSSAELIRLNIRMSFIALNISKIIDFVILISNLSVYVFSAFLIYKNELTVGSFVAVIAYFNTANGSLKRMNSISVDIQQKKASIDKVYELLELDTEESGAKCPHLYLNKADIRFEEVSFSYTKEKLVLKNINLSIKNGEQIALVGKSGSGKSTLIGLLIRFYNPDAGRIMIDGIDIRHCSLNSLRKNIGVVMQETLLFEESIRYNLQVGNPGCSEKEIWDACEKAAIADFIRQLPQGLDTVLGKGGMNMSGGQRQRIAIARIFIKNPKIVILDEATSALDYEAEKSIQKALKELRAGRTTIIIAHRLSTILDSDRVAVLDDGQIVSCDHHLNLLNSCEKYQNLFKEQYLGQEVSITV